MENEVKEPAPKYQYISPDEYLLMERASDLKHEYYNGYVEAMCGASLKHNRIERNLAARVCSYLEGKKCEWLPSNMRVSIPDRAAYLYPDATIVCNEPELEDDKFDTLLNPSVIFQTLSPSTRKNYLTHKLFYYQQIESLREYILIDSVKRSIYVYRRKEDKTWQSGEIPAAANAVYIQTIDFTIKMDDIYYLTGVDI